MHVTPVARFGLAMLLGAALSGIACASPPPQQILPPGVYLSDLEPVGGGLFEQRIRLHLRVTNPNAFDIDTRGLSFDLAMNGERLVQGVSSEPVVLPALGETLVAVEATTTTFELLHQLRRLSERRELSYELTGRFLLAEGIDAVWLGFERSARLGPAAPRPGAPGLPD